MSVVDLVGWCCTALVLAAYAAHALGAPVAIFDASNVVGAVGIGASAYRHRAWPSLALTAAFGVIGMVALVTA